jgi:hypothetical protein
MAAAEPVLLTSSLTTYYGIPFLAYFVGIAVRKIALPGPQSPALLRQMVLGVPIALVIVSPLLPVFEAAIAASTSSYLLTVGLVMEQGMIVQEVATRHIDELKKKIGGPPEPPKTFDTVSGA